MTSRQIEEVRYQERQWKAGYRAARRHREMTVVAIVIAAVVLLRRWRFPTAVIFAWITAALICFAPVWIVAGLFEIRRRHKVKAALRLTEKDDLFPRE
jgi:hypothetical protein